MDEVSLVADWVKVMFDKMAINMGLNFKHVHDVRMKYQNIYEIDVLFIITTYIRKVDS